MDSRKVAAILTVAEINAAVLLQHHNLSLKNKWPMRSDVRSFRVVIKALVYTTMIVSSLKDWRGKAKLIIRS